MKQKLIAALVTSAIAGLAATTANAGVIQATYKVYAAEVFGDDAAVLKAPLVSYNLSRPISGSVAAPNTFKISLTLSSGKFFATDVANYRAVLRDPSSSRSLPNSAAGGVLSNDDKTITFTFIADQDGVTYPANSTITFGDFAVAAPASAGASLAPAGSPVLEATDVAATLKAPLDSACAPTQKDISVTVKMTNASDIEVDTNDPGFIVTTPVLASNVALNITGNGKATWKPAADVVAIESSKVDVLTPSNGVSFTAGDATDATITTSTINLGSITIKNRASLFDIDGGKQYLVSDTDWAKDVAGGDGGVSAKELDLTITGKFPSKDTTEASVFLAADPACTALAGGTGVAKISDDLTTATIKYTGFTNPLTGAEWAVVGGERTAYVCYTNVAAKKKVISPALFKLTAGSLLKQSTSKELANPVCPADMYELKSNGVQIDVRNYIQKAQADATGWLSVLRIINTDENQTAVVNAQLIKDDGTVLKAAPVVTLAPRAFKYMSSTEIEALLPESVGVSGNNARLRLTSANSSLRVQNYHLNPVTGAVTEVSAAQGDDGPTLSINASMNK